MSERIVLVRKRIASLTLFALLGLCACGRSAYPPQQASPQTHDTILENDKKQIVMGWNAFGTTDSYIQLNSPTPQMNVVSPRWFTLNAESLVSGEVDTRYVEWAHQSGRKVWAFFGNQFNAELTDSLIGNPDNHKKIAKLLAEKMVPAKVDGLNVDFENIDPKNKDDFVGFIKALKKTLSPHGIVLSVDVTRENPDPYWSGSYDRKELGKAADYIVMMGYDEDLGGGERVGSVASLDWVEEGLQLLLKEVPSRKVILAVPFYTREWVTNLQTNVSTRFDRSMVETEQLLAQRNLKKKWDDKAKQNYVEFVENGEKHQIWIEDEMSMKNRLDLVNKYKLKGTAAWYIGQEDPGIWQVFQLQ
ncbi:glycosyl hydrolase family 18 protein [Brevibacillus brevis]|uniref:Glycosyl hydrolase family 18 protein n=1 Tax=Brevibacillus brevis TaxID=1393 RepID=A0ABY9SWH4_BREBE|nr:glycosyl hydrolase family 18 protein [Brevibacillus brevis]WNC12159.1 glycosyl hydrolase family 18 protein [Brevibacillus brevis]